MIVMPRTAAIEQELISGIRTSFGKTLLKVDRLDGAWTEETIRLVTSVSPAVYVAWIGGRRDPRRGVIMGTWGLFSSASVLSGQRKDSVGAYDINDRLVAWLEGRQLTAACGAANFTQIANLYSKGAAKTGTVVCGLYFDIPQQMPSRIDEGDIGEFETYYHQWPQADGAPVQDSFNTHLYTGTEHE
ncbi:phage protein Gp37 [Limnobaculum xujianqingii]|uniref:phage protein Gp37 n=1 Tax=Limnobaculum xujianqingii TaxID=2738837 RepID=UPI0011261088|nr:phage protein Gp37 [Limnobaculum xujianqingii]